MCGIYRDGKNKKGRSANINSSIERCIKKSRENGQTLPNAKSKTAIPPTAATTKTVRQKLPPHNVSTRDNIGVSNSAETKEPKPIHQAQGHKHLKVALSNQNMRRVRVGEKKMKSRPQSEITKPEPKAKPLTAIKRTDIRKVEAKHDIVRLPNTDVPKVNTTKSKSNSTTGLSGPVTSNSKASEVAVHPSSSSLVFRPMDNPVYDGLDIPAIKTLHNPTYDALMENKPAMAAAPGKRKETTSLFEESHEYDYPTIVTQNGGDKAKVLGGSPLHIYESIERSISAENTPRKVQTTSAQIPGAARGSRNDQTDKGPKKKQPLMPRTKKYKQKDQGNPVGCSLHYAVTPILEASSPIVGVSNCHFKTSSNQDSAHAYAILEASMEECWEDGGRKSATPEANAEHCYAVLEGPTTTNDEESGGLGDSTLAMISKHYEVSPNFIKPRISNKKIT